MKRRNPLTPDATKRLLARYQEGAGLIRLAKEFGRGKTFVRSVLLEHGCEIRPTGTHHVAGRVDLDVGTMLALRREGMPYRAIARRLGCSATLVRRRVLGLG